MFPFFTRASAERYYCISYSCSQISQCLCTFSSYTKHFFPEFAVAYVYEEKQITAEKFSLKDIVGDGFLLAVPKFRRTLEKRLTRKFGSPEYHWKMLVPQTNIKVCHECGHHHERGRLCGQLYFCPFNGTNCTVIL